MQKLQKTPCPSRQQDAVEYQKCCEFLLSHLAQQDDSSWSVARRLLIEQYALPEELVDGLHEANSIYATHSDIVFAHRSPDSKPIIGATLLPIKGKSLWKTIGNDRQSWFIIGDLERAFCIIAVENPIEALSYSALFPGKVVVSCGDSLREFMGILNKGQRVVLAFCDADKIIKAGRARRKANGVWTFEGHRTEFKSWNEELHFRKQHCHSLGEKL